MSSGVKAVVALLVVVVLVLAGVVVALLLGDTATGADGGPSVVAVPVDGGSSSPAASPTEGPADEPSPTVSSTPVPPTFQQTYADVRSGVVRLETIGCAGSGNSRGSGFLVAPQLAVTNAHVVAGARYIAAVLDDGVDAVRAQVMAIDDAVDLALVSLSPSHDGHVFELAEQDPTELMEVATIGFPLGQPLSVSTGVVGGVGRELDEVAVPLVQTDASMNPGNSGGPLIDVEGRVVGVSVGTFRGADGLNFAVPVTAVHERLDAWTEGRDVGDASLVTCAESSEEGFAAGETVVTDLVGTDRSAAVAETLQRYFDGINSRTPSVTWGALATSYRERVDRDSFDEGVSTSYDVAIVLRGLTTDADGTPLARVTFTSWQDPDYAPDGESPCVDWDLHYPLVDEAGEVRLEQSRAAGERAWEPCP